jgi:hypothetical protein
MLIGTLVQTIVLLFITLRTDWEKQVTLTHCLLTDKLTTTSVHFYLSPREYKASLDNVQTSSYRKLGSMLNYFYF